MPHFAIRTQVTRPAMMSEGLNEHERAAFRRHSAWLKQQTEAGLVRFVGRSPAGWAMCVFEAGSEKEAHTFMNSDPFVQAGVVTPELFPIDVLYPPAQQ